MTDARVSPIRRELSRWVSAELRRHRKLTGSTQRQLALITGVSMSTLSNWENGRKLPSMEHVILLAQAMGIDPCQLVPTLKDIGLAPH